MEMALSNRGSGSLISLLGNAAFCAEVAIFSLPILERVAQVRDLFEASFHRLYTDRFLSGPYRRENF
jgi:hypothetical protein